jgi:signal transduction histidine kinase
MGPEEFTHPDYIDLLRENIKKRMEGEKEAITYNLVVTNKEGGSIPVKVLGQVTEYRGKPAIMGTLLDQSREMELEKQLLHSQKMEAIGKLAGGIAHDFNNILTAIIGFGSLLKVKMPPDFPERDQVDQILAAAERGANLTKSLLTFSRKQMYDFAPTDLDEAVSNVKTLIERIIGEDVTLNLSLAPEDLIVSANVGLLEQVLMNLSVNSRDAMPEGGTLSIETASIQVDEKSAIDLGIGNPGKYAILKVSDTGMGIDEENIERIFDPFFTTKGVGKGTGLGLSIVYGIITQHGGYISVSSEQGGATVFTIYLPLSSENRDKKASPRKHDDLSGEESILIAEDDSNIRDVFVDLLTRFGYEVTEAVNGREALQKYNEKRGSIDILLFDVVMPEMNGWEAYLKIKEIKPETKVIFMSAYTADTIKKQGLLTEGIRLLPKPLSPVEMLRTVREVLDR